MDILTIIFIRLGQTRVNPDISRVRGVHLQGAQGRSRSKLLEVPDNAANERLGHALRGNFLRNCMRKRWLQIGTRQIEAK